MKIGIVGSGLVGSTAAYAMVTGGVGREIVLVDKNEKRAEAEANDILHAVPFSNPLLVRKGDYSDLKKSRAVVISAGASQRDLARLGSNCSNGMRTSSGQLSQRSSISLRMLFSSLLLTLWM